MTSTETDTATPDDGSPDNAAQGTIIERALIGVQAALVSMSARNRALEEERDRLTREIAALARVLADSGLLKGIDPRRVEAAARRQDETALQLKAAEASAREAEARVRDVERQVREARLARNRAETQYRKVVKSTSWRITGPLRRVIRLVRRR